MIMDKIKIAEMKKDLSVYDQKYREYLLEDDEMEAFEEGFMRGWDEAY